MSETVDQPPEPTGRLGEETQGHGDYIIDPRLDKDTADRLVAAGVTHAPIGSKPAVAKWVADGYAKLPKGETVPPTVEFNDAALPSTWRPLMIGPFSEQCLNCRHLHREAPGMSEINCDAFPSPEIIPLDIMFGGFDHTRPFPGDHGIRFEPIKEPAPVESASS